MAKPQNTSSGSRLTPIALCTLSRKVVSANAASPRAAGFAIAGGAAVAVLTSAIPNAPQTPGNWPWQPMTPLNIPPRLRHVNVTCSGYFTNSSAALNSCGRISSASVWDFRGYRHAKSVRVVRHRPGIAAGGASLSGGRRCAGLERQPDGPVLPEQTERAGDGNRRQPSERRRRGLERRDRRGGVQRRRPRQVSIHGGYRRLGLLLLERLGQVVDPAHVHRLDRAQLPRTSRLRGRRRIDRHPTLVLRERPGFRRRPGPGVRPEARLERFQLDQRLAPVLREPDGEFPWHTNLQGIRGDRGLAHG